MFTGCLLYYCIMPFYMYANVILIYKCYKIVIMDNAIDEMVNYTSIRVEKEVRDRLDGLGKRRESYNEIIKRLIEFYESRKTEEE